MNETICIFSAQYLPHMGGVENYTAHLAQELAKRGLHIVIVTCNTENAAERENDAGVEVLRLPCRNLMGGRYPLLRKNARFQELWRTLKDRDVTHVVVNTRFYPLSHLGITYAHDRGIVPIVIEHGSAHLTAGIPLADKAIEAVEHAITKANLKYPADYYAVSKKASTWLSHFGIVSKGEIPNSIDAEAYAAQASARDFRAELKLDENSFVVAFVGRLVKEKGIPVLLEAAKRLEAEGVQFVLAGEGPLRSAVEASPSPNVHLMGRLSTPDVAALLTQANTLCLPSRSEGFSTTLLETAACGTAIIATDVGGAQEIAPDTRYGTVLPDAKPKTIVRAIKRLADDPSLATAQGERARQRVAERYSWSTSATLLLDACKRA